MCSLSACLAPASHCASPALTALRSHNFVDPQGCARTAPSHQRPHHALDETSVFSVWCERWCRFWVVCRGPQAIKLFPGAGSKQNISKRVRLLKQQLASNPATAGHTIKATQAASAQATAKRMKRSQGNLPASIPLPSWRPEQVRQIRVSLHSLSLQSHPLQSLPLHLLPLHPLSLSKAKSKAEMLEKKLQASGPFFLMISPF